MPSTELPYAAATPQALRARDLLALLLLASSRGLGALAARVAARQREPAGDGITEFHGEAGAPEGALYVDGRLVGHVLGVNRL